MIGILFGISIFAGGLIMMWVHWNTWQAESDRAKTKGDRIFFIRKFRRRTLMGSMIAIIGAMMTTWFYADDDPRVKFVLVAGMLLLLLGLTGYALVDALSVYVHFHHGKEAGVASKRLAEEYKRLKEKAADAAEEEAGAGEAE